MKNDANDAFFLKKLPSYNPVGFDLTNYT
jgi:hypothetical protein